MLHPEWLEIAAEARESGIGTIHLRTELTAPDAEIARLVEDAGSSAGVVDVVSVDLMAGDRQTYALIMGVDAFDRVSRNVELLVAGRRGRARAGGIPTPWIVPRLTRCDAVYEQIEGFYDSWLGRCGHCVIDPLPHPVCGERIEPLPLPASAAWRRARSGLSILSDGSVPNELEDVHGVSIAGSLRTESVRDLWKRLHRARLDARTQKQLAVARAAALAGAV